MKKRERQEIEDRVRCAWNAQGAALNERAARHWVADEANRIGYGGPSIVSRATGMARSTINIGRHEIRMAVVPDNLVRDRTRRNRAQRHELMAKVVVGDCDKPLASAVPSESDGCAHLTETNERVEADELLNQNDFTTVIGIDSQTDKHIGCQVQGPAKGIPAKERCSSRRPSAQRADNRYRRRSWVSTRTGKFVCESQRTEEKCKELWEFIEEAEAHSELTTWRRGRAVIGYIRGKSAALLAEELDMSVPVIIKWLKRYNADGCEGLSLRTAPGAKSRLTEEQLAKLKDVITAGPQSVGFTAGVWTGPMIKQWIETNFGVHYHSQHIPRLLHQLGFSVQRPRKLLARADREAQRRWVDERFPEVKKK